MRQVRHFENVTRTATREATSIKTLIDDIRRVVSLLEDDFSVENERLPNPWLFGSRVLNFCEDASRAARKSKGNDLHAGRAVSAYIRRRQNSGHIYATQVIGTRHLCEVLRPKVRHPSLHPSLRRSISSAVEATMLQVRSPPSGYR